ncbi:hypothetical protein N8291_02055 [Pseudomonadales bacterium]|nr:hypothetical protein [Pseudomonadales bacterium]
MFNTTRSLFLMVCLAFAITASNGAYGKKKTLFELKDPAGTHWLVLKNKDAVALKKDGKTVCKEKIYFYAAFHGCAKRNADKAVLDAIVKAVKKVFK